MRSPVSCNGTITINCVFHREKTPSLTIWKSGAFWCHGCQESGHVREHAELLAIYSEVHPQLVEPVPHEVLEEAGQLRLPGFG